MPQKNYMQDQDVRDYYDKWINSPTLLDHPMDKERFYQFVKACISHVGKGELLKKLGIDILKTYLCDDLKILREGNYAKYEDTVGEIVSLFQTLLEYEDS